MKKLSGLDLSRRLRESMNDLYTEIAFVTGTSCYDRLLFDVQPLSFIPKPVERIKVIDTLRLAMKRQNESAKVFTFKTGREHVCVPLSEILYMESRNRIITVVTLSETYTYYGRLHKAEEHLPLLLLSDSQIIYRQFTTYTPAHHGLHNTDGKYQAFCQRKLPSGIKRTL